MLRKRNFLKPLAYFLSVLVLLGIALVAPIDRTPLADQPFYQQTMQSLDTLAISRAPKAPLKAGWAKVNITPEGPMPMAGYRRRNQYERVHDSLYVRILLIQNNDQPVALINADLLLFPPVLKQRLEAKLAAVMPGIFLYLSATHTHNSLGAWDDSLGGQLAVGEFDYAWINRTVNAVAAAIQNIKPIPASVQYWESDAHELVINRIARQQGKKDGVLRGFMLNRQDSAKACLFTFSAHPTTLSKKNQTLSADYPADVINRLEEAVDFSMFMAGMMGSHAFTPMPPEKEYDLVEKEGAFLTEMIGHMKAEDPEDSIGISTAHFPITFGSSQLRIAANWKARNWVFNTFLDDLQGELTYLKIGNILMIGTPCDFSGEIAVNEKLHAYSKARGLNLIITSFNGNYVGYITHDGHYDSINKTEVRTMNWVGPYYGQYFAEMIKKIIDKSP
jgi:neutral ceramidase